MGVSGIPGPFQSPISRVSFYTWGGAMYSVMPQIMFQSPISRVSFYTGGSLAEVSNLENRVSIPYKSGLLLHRPVFQLWLLKLEKPFSDDPPATPKFWNIPGILSTPKPEF